MKYIIEDNGTSLTILRYADGDLKNAKVVMDFDMDNFHSRESMIAKAMIELRFLMEG